ncbi:MAG: hypothetical protein FH756_00465 [Firmicutes bacterium]|nr:hypothetical protein [Bacillota bacterium]
MKKMFRVNEDGVAEWVVAENKQQAIKFCQQIWGENCIKEAFKEYLQDVPGSTFENFVDYYVQEENPKNKFTFHHDNGEQITKTINEFLNDVREVPSYFACQDY